MSVRTKHDDDDDDAGSLFSFSFCFFILLWSIEAIWRQVLPSDTNADVHISIRSPANAITHISCATNRPQIVCLHSPGASASSPCSLLALVASSPCPLLVLYRKY